MILKSSIFLITLISVHANAFKFGDILQRAPERECTQQGLMCGDCYSIVYCTKNENGEWDQVLVEECTDGRTCTKDIPPAFCTFAQNDECDEFNFRCRQAGLFPHPFDCKKYFNCIVDENGVVDPKPRRYECKNDYGYDPLTTICRLPLKNGECDGRLVDSCWSAGRIDPIPGNPYMYSICLTDEVNGRQSYYPQIFYCNDNEIFVDDECVPVETGLDSEGKCLRTGFFYDPFDCKKYKECLLSGVTPTGRSCAFGYEFDPIKHTCVLFRC